MEIPANTRLAPQDTAWYLTREFNFVNSTARHYRLKGTSKGDSLWHVAGKTLPGKAGLAPRLLMPARQDRDNAFSATGH
jgi:hypothetical protein